MELSILRLYSIPSLHNSEISFKGGICYVEDFLNTRRAEEETGIDLYTFESARDDNLLNSPERV